MRSNNLEKKDEFTRVKEKVATNNVCMKKVIGYVMYVLNMSCMFECHVCFEKLDKKVYVCTRLQIQEFGNDTSFALKYQLKLRTYGGLKSALHDTHSFGVFTFHFLQSLVLANVI